MKDFTPNQLLAHLENSESNPLFLDVREKPEYDYCRIEGSVLIPLNQVPGRIAELDPDQEIVVICHHGVRSMQVAHYLEQHGFNQIINLKGGIDAWSLQADPSIKRY